MLKANDDLVIRLVANGFEITPHLRGGDCLMVEHVHVFRSMSELTSFVEDHFDFRNTKDIKSDTV